MFIVLNYLSLGFPICEMWIIKLLPRSSGLSELLCARSFFNAIKHCTRVSYHEWWQYHYFKVKGEGSGRGKSKVSVCRAAWPAQRSRRPAWEATTGAGSQSAGLVS